MASPLVVHESDYYRVERLGEHEVLRLTRKAKPFITKEDVERACRPLQLVLTRVGRGRLQLLIDSRKVVGRNDPASEANFLYHRCEMVKGFARCAILVATPTGKLHAQRLLSEDGTASSSVKVFLDEAEALAFLVHPHLKRPRRTRERRTASCRCSRACGRRGTSCSCRDRGT